MALSHSSRVGELNETKAEFKWEIKNIHNLLNQDNNIIFSPDFRSVGDLTWNLKMHTNGYNDESNTYISIFLQLRKDVEHTTNYSLSILNNKKLQCYQRICGIRTFSLRQSLGFSRFIRRQDLFDKRNQYLFEDTLVILLELYLGSYNVCSRPLINFEDVFNNKQFSDVDFTVRNEVEDKHLYAHKSVLSRKSDIFEAMFKHEMKEVAKNVVLIEDIDYQVMVELFRFIYTGEVRDMEKVAEKLLIAANKYAIIDLQDVCSDYFYHKLSNENVIEYLDLAVRYNADKLRHTSMEYILENAKSMIKTAKFRLITALPDNELYDIICKLVLSKKE